MPAGWIVTHLGESKLSLFIPDPLWIRRTKDVKIHKHGTNGCASYGTIVIFLMFFYSFSVNLLVGDLEEVLQQNLDTEEKAISCSFHRKYHSNFIFFFPAFSHMYQTVIYHVPHFWRQFLAPTRKSKNNPFHFFDRLHLLVECGRTSYSCQRLWGKPKLERLNYHQKVKFWYFLGSLRNHVPLQSLT